MLRVRSVLGCVLLVAGVGWLGWIVWNAYSLYRIVSLFGGPVEIGLSPKPIDNVPHALAMVAAALGVALLWPRKAPPSGP